MSKRLEGFDAFLSEHRAKQQGETRTIVIRGQEYNLPPSIPASVVLRVQRLQRDLGNEGQIPSDEVLTISTAIFGEGVLEKISEEHNLDVEELGELIKYVIASYGSDENESEEENPTPQLETKGEVA